MRTTLRTTLIAALLVEAAACSSHGDATATGGAGPGSAHLVAAGSGAARVGHVAALLGDGRVLLAGGSVGGSATASAEIFDPSTGQFTPTGPLTVARVHATATVLQDGRVLVVGGDDGAASPTALSSADLFDPTAVNGAITGAFSAAGPLFTGPRTRHTATRLASGQVVVLGGFDGTNALATAEAYTPATNSWGALTSLGTARLRHTATLLGDGHILVAGGEDAGATPVGGAELYDPTGGAPTPIALADRTRHVAALLTSGDVLVACGSDGGSDLGTSEVYHVSGPSAGTFTPGPGPVAAREDATATLLPDGRVVVAGGTAGAASNAADVFAADASTVSSPGHLQDARGGHAATLLPSGRVLLTGGGLPAAELLDRGSDGWTTFAPTNYQPRHGHTATLLVTGANAGRLLVVGGIDPFNAYYKSWQIFNPASSTTMPVAQNIANARAYHTATVLLDGSVVVTGGNTGAASRNDAEVFNGTSWTTEAAKMVSPRSNHTATLLPTGKVLLAGGLDGATELASAEVYDPLAHTFTRTMNDMSAPRAHHVATLLRDGRVLVAGGDGTRTADIYDPTTDTFTPTGALAQPTARAHFTATPLPDGRVLMAGGTNGSVELASAELFGGGAFGFVTGLAPSGRLDQAAAPLPAGEVIVAGGQDAGGFTATVERYEPASESFIQALVSPLNDARDWSTATQLPSGQILVWGGDDGTRTGADPELYDPFPRAGEPNPPDLSGALTSGVPGGYLSLTTSGFFTGGVGADTRSADVNNPVFVITREDGDGTLFARTAHFDATTARVQLPASAPSGWWWIRAIVGGVPGKALPFKMLDRFVIAPTTASVPPRGTVAFTATGGNAASYAWTFTASGSNDPADAPTLPAFTPTTGAATSYQAGANPGTTPVTDTVECTDHDGNTVTADVTVGPRISIANPLPLGAAPGQGIAFHAIGGCDPATYGATLCTGYTWSFVTNRSGGTITSGGAYVAGPNGGRIDDIQVVDNLGNHAQASVAVTLPLVIAPTTATVTPWGTQGFTASNGCDPAVYPGLCSAYTWQIVTAGSGAPTIDAAGNYRAGRTGSTATTTVTDVVRVTDSLGNHADAVVTIGPMVTLTPPAATTPPRGPVAFTAAGGNDTFTGCSAGSCWSFVNNRSGGTIDASGNYTAGATPDVSDVIQVQDTLGNVATATITVGPGVTLSPLDPGAYPGQTVTLTASGGSGTFVSWQLTTVNSNGGVVNPVAGTATAVYTAGTRRGATDVLVVTDSLGNTATTDLVVWPDWKPGGSGCSAAGGGGGGGGALGLLLVALWLALRGRPRRARPAGAALILLAVVFPAAGARAQTPPVSYSFIVDRFQPLGGAYDILAVQSAQTAGHLQKTFRLDLNYATKPLVLSAPGMSKVALLRSQLAADLTASVGVRDWAEISLAVPFMLSQSREQDRFLPPELRQSVAASGLGDPRVTFKARLLEWGKLRLGVSAPIGLPLGNRKAFLGEGGITVSPTALVELDALGPARLLLNGGAILRPERKLIDLTVGNAYTFGAGFEYPFQLGDSRLAALATLAGESGMKSSPAGRPMELLAGGRWSAPSGLEVAFGGGPGIGKGYGTPQYRVFLEVGYGTATADRLAQQEKPKEEAKPEEPKAAEPAPAAEPPAPPPEEPKAEPPPEPKAEEPKQPEPKAEPEPAPEAEVIRIDAKIYFDFNKKDLKDEYKPALRRLAKRILGDPRMRVVRIEGHADDLGPPDYNLWLSEERARAVKEFLERSGVPAGRFAVIGYGKTKPNRPGRTPDDRAKNRRVEFSVQEY